MSEVMSEAEVEVLMDMTRPVDEVTQPRNPPNPRQLQRLCRSHETLRAENERLRDVLGNLRTQAIRAVVKGWVAIPEIDWDDNMKLMEGMWPKQALREEEVTCLWTEDEYHACYETDCGEVWQFTEGTLADNEISYCPYCGRRIKIEEARQ